MAGKKLPEEQVRELRSMLREGVPRAEISRRLGISKSAISYHASRMGVGVKHGTVNTAPAPTRRGAPFPGIDGSQPCLSHDPELFFEHDGIAGNPGPRELAHDKLLAAICAGCPFRRACLAYALTHDVNGTWGGVSRRERLRLQREHGIDPVPMYLGHNVSQKGRSDDRTV
jgi:DNA-binding transcriptional ArsR family regulator